MGSYRSKVDGWLVAVMVVTGAMAAVAVVAVLAAQGPLVARLAYAAGFLLLGGFVTWVFLDTGYELEPQVLKVRSGPMKWRIPLAAIHEVRPTSNPLSSPALSLDRLHVRYRGSSVGMLVSPADREGFLAELAALAPHLEHTAGVLVERGENR
jgi:hypothetical protein